MKSYTIGKNDAGQRVDKFIEKAVPLLPKNLLYKYIRLKRIKLNHRRCEISTRLAEGDILELYINDEFFGEKKNSGLTFLSAPKTLDIIYEDGNVMLLDKKCGLVVHDDENGGVDTLINRVLHYLYDKGEYNPENENSFAPALCNRIDRNTTGIVICAKNAESLRILNQKIKDRELSKQYLCVTIGVPKKREDTCTAFLEKNEQTKTVRISDRKTDRNKMIVTKYRVVDEADGLALLEVDLITGRTHQIRAHMAYLGYPLLGDGKYGSNAQNRKWNVKTQALCSHKLTFDFSTDSGILSYLDKKSFCTPPPWFVEQFFRKA